MKSRVNIGENRALAPRDVKRLAVGGLFVALMCVSAWIRIPLPTPIGVTYLTLQSAVALLVALLLSPLEALTVMSAYLALGLAGLPVFANPQFAGLGSLASPTFGYLIGFLIGAPVGSLALRWLSARGRGASLEDAPRLIDSLVAGWVVIALVFVCGIAYSWAYARYLAGAPIAFASLVSLTTGVLLVKDIALTGVIASVALRLRMVVR